jgi:hypothetical protein
MVRKMKKKHSNSKAYVKDHLFFTHQEVEIIDLVVYG